MSNLKTICRPYTVFSSIICCRHRQRARPRVSLPNPNYRPQFSSAWFDSLGLNSNGAEPWYRVNQRRTMVHASNWSDQKSPYETLGIYFSFSFYSSSQLSNQFQKSYTQLQLQAIFIFYLVIMCFVIFYNNICVWI